VRGWRTVDLDDLRGRVLHIIAQSGGEEPEPVLLKRPDVVTIIASRQPFSRPAPTVCVTREPEVWTAFATILGLTPDALAGAQVLVDQNAWLRAAWRPGEPGDWTDPRKLAAEIEDISAHPLAVAASGAHVHRH
jgi:hypothetical protein